MNDPTVPAATEDVTGAPDPAPAPAAVAKALATGRAKPGMGAALWRFAVVGGVGTLVNLAVLHLLHGIIGLGFTRSSALATEAAIVGNYLGNELWTFHHRRLSWRRLVQYNAAALLGLAVTVVVATLLKEIVHPLLAQLVGIGAGSVTNFALNFGWIWRR